MYFNSSLASIKSWRSLKSLRSTKSPRSAGTPSSALSRLADLDLGLGFKNRGSEISERDSWIFVASPRMVKLHKRFMLTALSSCFRKRPLLGVSLILSCIVCHTALELLHPAGVDHYLNFDADDETAGLRTSGAFSVLFVLVDLVATVVALHYVNRDLFLRQIMSFDSLVIIFHGLGILSINIGNKAVLLKDQYDKEWMIGDIARALALLPCLVVMATLDSVRMRNFWKMVLLMVGVSTMAYQFFRLEFSLIRFADDVCSGPLSCHGALQRTYQACCRTLGIFWLKAAVAYATGHTFAVVRPRFQAVERSNGEQWCITQMSERPSREREAQELDAPMGFATPAITLSNLTGISRILLSADSRGVFSRDTASSSTQQPPLVSQTPTRSTPTAIVEEGQKEREQENTISSVSSNDGVKQEVASCAMDFEISGGSAPQQPRTWDSIPVLVRDDPGSLQVEPWTGASICCRGIQQENWHTLANVARKQNRKWSGRSLNSMFSGGQGELPRSPAGQLVETVQEGEDSGSASPASEVTPQEVREEQLSESRPDQRPVRAKFELVEM